MRLGTSSTQGQVRSFINRTSHSALRPRLVVSASSRGWSLNDISRSVLVELVAATADGVIDQSVTAKQFRVVHVTAIDHYRLFKGLGNQVKVRGAELFPFRTDHQCISTPKGLLLGAAELEIVPAAVDTLGLFHGLRVKALDLRAGFPQRLHECAGRCFTHIVGVGLERQPPDGNGLVGQVTLEVVADLVEQDVLLGVVHFFYRIQQRGLIADTAGGTGQGLYVFREAGAAIAAARVDKVVSNTGIGTNAPADSF